MAVKKRFVRDAGMDPNWLYSLLPYIKKNREGGAEKAPLFSFH